VAAVKLRKMHVQWVDSIGTSGWHPKHEDSNINCETFGFYISENKVSLKLALNYSFGSGVESKGCYGDFIEIPKVAIKKRRWM